MLQKFLISCFIALLLAFAMVGRSSHATEPGFFEGKRLTYIVATKPGGGYDQYARLIARYLPRYLGVRSVAIRNVPGASHLIGLQQLFVAAPDGLTIGTFNTGLLIGIERAAVNYDLSQLSWIGKAAAEPRVFIVPLLSALQTFGDLRTRTTPVWHSNPERAWLCRARSGFGHYAG
jgi:tripartite-type tricarboxylate transporter receptor subunit TctC